MSTGWVIACSLWVGGIFATWDECCALLAQIPRTVRRLLRLK